MNPVIASIIQACLPVTGLTVARNRSIDLCILYMNRIEFLIIAVDSQNVVYLIRVIICFLSIECPPCVEFRSIVKKSLIEGKMEFTIEIFCDDLDRQRTNVSLKRHDRHKRSIDHRVKLLIIVHCFPREFSEPVFLLPDSCTRVRAGLMFVTRAVIFHRVRGKYIQWGIQSNAVVGKGIVLSGIL